MCSEKLTRGQYSKWAFLPLLLCVIGCGGPQVYPVRGNVTYDGNKVPTGWVKLIKEGGDPISSVISSDGTYQLEAPQGTYRVAISAPRQLPPGTKPEDTFRMKLPPPHLPTRYNSSERSGLKATVEDVEDNVIDFPLKPLSRKKR